MFLYTFLEIQKQNKNKVNTAEQAESQTCIVNVKVTATAELPGRAAVVDVSFGMNKLKGTIRAPDAGEEGCAMIDGKSGHLDKTIITLFNINFVHNFPVWQISIYFYLMYIG